LLVNNGIHAMNMPTRHAGEPTAYYIGPSAGHTPEMDVIYTGRESVDGSLKLYNIRLNVPTDVALSTGLEYVADAAALMATPEWSEDNE
jgi:hypothetical protein